jgi:hypothetical protein
LIGGAAVLDFCRVIFTESASFARKVFQILTEMQLIELENLLLELPEAGDLIPGSRGLRKIRVASGGKGKRGGARVIYYWYVEPEKIQFCRIYGKSTQTDISQAELQQILTELDS